MTLGAEEGDPNCQHLIGYRYKEGKDGFSKSPEEAKRWLLAATEQGQAKAEFCLADLFREEGNDAEYVRYLRASASKGYDHACYQLGQAYIRGECGLQESTKEAIRVATPAAENGHTQSMALLGFAMCFPEPWVDPRNDPNFTKGVHWLRKGAGRGNETSIELLGMLEGIGDLCFMCGKNAAKEAPPKKAHLRCSRCRAAWYCSKNCQAQHWNAEEGGHKQCCIKWK